MISRRKIAGTPAANCDIIALMKLGGWKSEKMVQRYAHVNVSHLAESIDALPWADDRGALTHVR